MASIDENFVVKTGLTVGTTEISAATGNITMTSGTITVGDTVIDAATGNITIGGTTINGATGAITTSANINTTGTFSQSGTPVASSTTLAATSGSINGVTVGSSTRAAGAFTTLAATNNVTVSADIMPTANNVSNIGSATNRFSTIFVNEARLSTNTLFIGDTPILGTSDNVINIHANSGQGISMQTSGAAGTMAFVSNAQVSMQTTGNNADVLVQSNGTGSKTRLLSSTAVELTAPTMTVVSNVTTTGTSIFNGTTTINGNLTVTGTTTAVNTTDLNVQDNVIILNSGETGVGVTASGGLSGVQFARGQISSYQLVFRESDDSLQFGPVGNLTKVAVENGSGVIVGNITGSAATATSATTAGTVTTAAQPAITSVGTLTSLTTSGDVTVGGNLVVNGTTTTINATELAVADLNITVAKNAATAAAANGAGLTVAGANATLTYGNTNDNFTFNKRVDATSFYGSGAGLTSVPNGALTNSSVTVTAGTGMSGGGSVSLGGTVTLTNTGVTQLTQGGGITVSGATGSITLGSTATSANTASAIVARDVSGNFTAGTITASLTGTASASTTCGGFTPSASSGVLNRIVVADASGYINNTYFNSSDNSQASGVTAVMVKAGDNYYRSGTSAAISTFLSLANSATTTSTDLATANTIVKRDANASFSANVVTAVATSARYADLAENYTADVFYTPGTVVEFGGAAEVTEAAADTRKVAGVVSTNPAYLMNNELGGTKVAVALQGRVPCRVVGKVSKGDMLVSAGNGAARAEADPKLGQVIGKALESFNGTEGVIEVVVGRM